MTLKWIIWDWCIDSLCKLWMDSAAKEKIIWTLSLEGPVCLYKVPPDGPLRGKPARVWMFWSPSKPNERAPG